MEEVLRRQALEENRGKQVQVSMHRAGAECVVVITDQGKGFEWSEFLEISPDRAFAPNGRGIAVSRQVAFSSLSYHGKGNVVEVRYPCTEDGAA